MILSGSELCGRWIASSLICIAVWQLGLGSPSPAAEVSETAKKAKAILEQRCYACHGEAGSADGGINFVLDRSRLVKRKKVVPGKSAESPLFRQVKTGSMPKDAEPLSKDELEVLKTWIDSGADDFNPPPKNAVKVTQETPLEVGTKLKVKWGRSRNDATGVSLPENGGVEIKGEGWSTAEVVAPECFVIDKAVLAKLEANAKKTTTSDNPTKPDDKPITSTEDTGKFKLVLAAPGAKKIAVIKLVMEITGLDLSDAKELVDSTPFEIKGNLSKADAKKWQKKLKDAGASAEIEAAKTDAEKEK